VQALHRGGVQKLISATLKAANHRDRRVLHRAKVPHDRTIDQDHAQFEKAIAPSTLELRISDRQAALQPEFVVRSGSESFRG